MSCKKQCKNVTQAVNTITQRMKFPMCITEVTVDAERLKDGDYAGMCALQGCYGMAAVTKRDGRMFLVMRSLEAENDSLEGNQGNSEENEWEAVAVESSKIRIRMEADFQNQHDKVRFYIGAMKNGNRSDHGISSISKWIISQDAELDCLPMQRKKQGEVRRIRQIPIFLNKSSRPALSK